MSVTVAFITPDKVEFRNIDLFSVKELVGGWFTTLPSRHNLPFDVYANEEGHLLNLAQNHLATRIVEGLGYNNYEAKFGTIVGNVVVLGKDEQSLTQEQKDKIKSLI